MKKYLFFLLIILMVSITFAKENPRVFIFTDINIDQGDPDDRQSLIHLFWYADELTIEGIVPDRWNAQGYEACLLALEAYTKDYQNNNLKAKDYTSPGNIKQLIAKDSNHATRLFQKAAARTDSPLYVLIWGNMKLFKSILLQNPELSENIRLLTIGTGLMLERSMAYLPEDWEKHPPCQQINWNGPGRNEVYTNSRFDSMWWLEMNWTYEGMFRGEEPAEMFTKLTEYGRMGKHIKAVVKNHDWAQYFRVGDTPSVLYVIDPGHDLDDPTEPSWAGKFTKPFPTGRPNYYTDFSGDVEWDYANPCATWENHEQVLEIAVKTLLDNRQAMYEALIQKLNALYSTKSKQE